MTDRVYLNSLSCFVEVACSNDQFCKKLRRDRILSLITEKVCKALSRLFQTALRALENFSIKRYAQMQLKVRRLRKLNGLRPKPKSSTGYQQLQLISLYGAYVCLACRFIVISVSILKPWYAMKTCKI